MVESRRPSEEKRVTFGQIRGEMDIRHTFCRRPSHVLEDTVTFF